jgi:transposase-like protein
MPTIIHGMCEYCGTPYSRRARGRVFKYCSPRCGGLAKAHQLTGGTGRGPKSGPRKITREQIRQAVEEYQTGQSIAQLGKKYGLSFKNMRKWLMTENISFRPAHAPYQPIEPRFWKFVEKTDTCWIWTGAKDSSGYGYICCNGKNTKAAQVSWQIHIGPLPKGLWILHKCDNPPCVKPDHLFLGTSKDNVQDMVNKGRNRSLIDLNEPARFARGERHGHAKLTDTLVREMRALRANNHLTYASIAKKYGVSFTTAYQAVNKQNWKHI